MKINVKTPRKVRQVMFGGKLYGKLVLVLPELAAFASSDENDKVNISLEIYRKNPNAIPN